MDNTLIYYNQNAELFAQGTLSVDFKQTQDRFLKKLTTNACILDFGCGAGRDTKYFLEKGYQVDATDGSEELCKLAVIMQELVLSRCFLKNLMKHKSMMVSGRVHPYCICLSPH